MPGTSLLVTLICVAILLGGLSAHGVLVVSAVLGLKAVLLGSLMAETEWKAHY
ncbi:hypothetical protein [Vibrio superstes]|uniref:hypothetical protein n=1 Tax=Vibrio superstes TaxID=198815 RepID=UPI0013C33582|nr:hypothetical protein [Vibrio superstes]